MTVLISPHSVNGIITVPGSKSHTIRRLLLASLTDGISHIDKALDSADTQSCAAACRVLGAEIIEDRNNGLHGWTVLGNKPGTVKTDAAVRSIDAGNSGTTLFFAIAAAALGSAPVTFTGDKQTARRSAGPLLDALSGLGIKAESKNGCIPITVRGPWKGGKVSMPCPTSQYLSALLIAAPLAPKGTITELEVPLLNERPYAEMTLAYLEAQDIYAEAAPDYSRFRIAGGNAYTPINGPVPGDFSSAAFPAAATAISGGKVTLQGLDRGDIQGDKIFFEYLSQMGCDVRWENKTTVTVSRSGPLRGGVFDLNATPDLLPVMAALGACAEGETALVNAAHARIKETDRIAVMAAELRKLFAGGFCCEENPDGLVLQGSGRANAGGSVKTEDSVSGITLDGHGDHRVVMALACAALAPGSHKTAINGAEAAEISYPGFIELLGKAAKPDTSRQFF